MSTTEALSVESLADLTEKTNPGAKRHAASVSRAAVAMAKEIGYSDDHLEAIEKAALLHDLGMISVASPVVMKSGRLTVHEFEVIRKHPTVGADMLRPIANLKDLCPVIAAHHERFDGLGYPFGKSKEEIPQEARILAVADTFVSMVTEQSYRPAFSPQKAIIGLKTGARSQLDPKLVEAFLAALNRLAPGIPDQDEPKPFVLDDLIKREKARLENTFQTLSVNLLMGFTHLFGYQVIHHLEEEINDFLKRNRLTVEFQKGTVVDRTPNRALMNDLAEIYRLVLARQLASMERLVGKQLTYCYMQKVFENLPEGG